MEIKYGSNEWRIREYEYSIESLQRILKATSRKDSDVREEIKEEIADLESYVKKLRR